MREGLCGPSLFFFAHERVEDRKMNKKELELFQKLRVKVADYIREYLKEDYGHKSYEGTWELLVSYPSYFDDDTASSSPDYYRVTLHCYVIGPSRHYDWSGKSFSEALEKCSHDIDIWVNE